MKMKVNGVEMEVESLEILHILEEPYCKYIAKDSKGQLYDVKIRATATAIRKLPIANPDGSPAFWVGHNQQVIVEEHREEIGGM